MFPLLTHEFFHLSLNSGLVMSNISSTFSLFLLGLPVIHMWAHLLFPWTAVCFFPFLLSIGKGPQDAN